MRQKRIKPRFKNPYKTENELCNIFIEYAKMNGWQIYPETSGFDILLVKNIQIGIQAKLHDNIEVLSQSVDGLYNNKGIFTTTYGPDIRAVLVPRASAAFKRIATILKIFVIEGTLLEWNTSTKSYSWIKKIDTDIDDYREWFLLQSNNKCWIPEVEINIPAGVSSPKQITPWKMKAVKLCIKLDAQGFLTSDDFKTAKISMPLWIQQSWIIPNNKKSGKRKQFIRNTQIKLPDQLYPEILEALKNTLKK